MVVAFLQLINLNSDQLSDAKSLPLEEQYPTCILYSDHNSEYLYAANFIYSFNFKRTVYTWKASYLFDSVYYSSAFNFTNKDPKGVWYLMPVDDYPDTFFLRNKHYDEYLYTSQYF